MIKLLNPDDGSSEKTKSLTQTKYVAIVMANGSGVYTFLTDKVLKEIQIKLKERKEELVSIVGYDAEYQDNGDVEVIRREIMFWANEIYSIKILNLNDAPFVEDV